MRLALIGGVARVRDVTDAGGRSDRWTYPDGTTYELKCAPVRNDECCKMNENRRWPG